MLPEWRPVLEANEMLAEWLEENGYQATSEPVMASYDPPWTLWFARRNEVQFEVR